MFADRRIKDLGKILGPFVKSSPKVLFTFQA